MRVYGLCAFNQRVSIFPDCAIERKDCLTSTPKEKKTWELMPTPHQNCHGTSPEVGEFSDQPGRGEFQSHPSRASGLGSFSPQPPILGHNLFKCASEKTAGPVRHPMRQLRPHIFPTCMPGGRTRKKGPATRGCAAGRSKAQDL